MNKLSSNIKSIKLMAVIMLLALLTFSCSTVDFYSSATKSSTSGSKDRSEISLLTYNIKAIYEKEENHIDSLVSFVNNESFDFVVFQELFDESTREAILNKADQEHYKTFISRVDYNSFPEFIFQDAGLFMMSKFLREDLSYIDFGDNIKNSNGIIHMMLDKEFSRTNDFLANKSVMGTLFNLNDSTKLFLFTTHVQAVGSTEHKQYQLSQIKSFIEKAVEGVLYSNKGVDPNNLIVLLAGDFNSNAYDNIRFNQFIKLLGYPRDLHKEFHISNEEYTFRDRPRRYDYILSYDKVGDINLKKIKTRSINVEIVSDEKGENISDHKAVKAVIVLDQDAFREKTNSEFVDRFSK